MLSFGNFENPFKKIKDRIFKEKDDQVVSLDSEREIYGLTQRKSPPK